MTAAETDTALPAPSRHGFARFLSPLVAIALVDVLLFRQEAGLNLFLLANTMACILLLSGRRRLSARHAAASVLLCLVASLPLMETTSWMGISVSLAGLACVSLAASGLMPGRLTRLPGVLLRLLLAIPGRLLRRAFRLGQGTRRSQPLARLRQRLRVWLVPLALASGFLLLFAIANPLIETALRRIDLALLAAFFDAQRLGIWLVAGFLAVILLHPRLKRPVIRPGRGPAAACDGKNGLFGPASLLRSLALFNAVFAVQTLLDITYLWGGASLPDGMSHAQYAHRGAYPLIVTALLAAGFVLAAMRPDGPANGNPLIRRLVYLWIGQNVLLCLSAMLRLDLYVETYSLTELRLAAGIWMGLVAFGLLLILLRILLRRSNEWLVALSCAALAATLFVSALTDIPTFVARFNVTHSWELSGEGLPLDLIYLSRLGPAAIPALDAYMDTTDATPARNTALARSIRNRLARAAISRNDDWRGWTFRKARIRAYLVETATVAR